MKNPHEKDQLISLDVASHSYRVHGFQESLISVTNIIERYLPKTDADVILDINYTKWQMDPYSYPLFAGRSRDDIKNEWLIKGRRAVDAGIRLHNAIELYYNGKNPFADSPPIDEWIQFLEFQERYHPIPYRTEMMIYSIQSMIAGTIDLLACNNDGTVTIYDWKRTIHPLYSSYTRDRGYGPLCKVPIGRFERYALQLNMYRAILEDSYGFKVKDMYLVRFHPSIVTYEIQQVLQMKEAEELLDATVCMRNVIG